MAKKVAKQMCKYTYSPSARATFINKSVQEFISLGGNQKFGYRPLARYLNDKLGAVIAKLHQCAAFIISAAQVKTLQKR